MKITDNSTNGKINTTTIEDGQQQRDGANTHTQNRYQ